MKIKSVCEKTGLTDRTVRYYIEEGLIFPSFTENYLGRRSYDFSEGDISKLCDIAVLRNFDFSIEEIREMLSLPESCPAIVKAVKERIGGGILESQKKMAALSLIDEGRVYTVSELAMELSKPEKPIPPKENVETGFGRRFASAAKAILSLLAVWLPMIIVVGTLLSAFFRYEHPVVVPAFLVISLLLFLPSVLSLLSSGIAPLGHFTVRRILLIMCLACIPISVFSSLSAVKECSHSYGESTVLAEADCVQEGRVMEKCGICGDVRLCTVARLPHTVVADMGREATCLAEGLTDGEHCSLCQTVLVGQEVIPKTAHSYVKEVIEPTCDKGGYTLWSCQCGYSYRDGVVDATEKHEFKTNGEYGYICSLCSLEVCEYGFVNGELLGVGMMRYYITGRADKVNVLERTLVIHGKGEMPAPRHKEYHPWRYSPYIGEIKTVIICDGVTSIAKGAFCGAVTDDEFFGNPFESVKRFVIKSAAVTVAPDSPDISGIECGITYEY